MANLSKWDRFDADAAEREVDRQVGYSAVEANTIRFLDQVKCS